jgi:hypothetical protein
MNRIWDFSRRFWFTPIDPIGLQVCRVLAGLVFLTWLLPCALHINELYGFSGWFDRQGYAEAARVIEDAPQQLGWSFLYVCGGNPAALQAAFWLSIAVLAAFTLGLAPRITGALSWVGVVSFSANPALEYEGDVLLALLAFYLMLGFLIGGGRRLGQSWLSWLLESGWPLNLLTRRRDDSLQPSLGANLALRLFQVHFALVMVTTGLHKLQFGDWWAGVALWYPLVPPLEATAAGARTMAGSAESFLFLISAAAYAVLAWQIAFPLFAWRSGWRWLLIGGAALGWLGTAFVYHLPVIGPMLLVGCLAYLSPVEYRAWQDRLGRWWRILRRTPPQKEVKVPATIGRRSARVKVGQPG